MEVIYMKKRTLVVFIAAGLLLCGCSGKNNNDINTNKDIDNNVDNNINYVVGDYDFSYNERLIHRLDMNGEI